MNEKLYDRNFILAFVSSSFFVLANTLLAHYARWIDFLGGDERDVGWIMGGGALVGLVCRPWVGQIIDRLGARKTLAIGYAIFAAAALGNLTLGDLGPGIYLLRTATVVGVAVAFASSLTYVTQITPPARRTEAIGISGAGGFFGMLFGPALGDWLLGASERTRGDFQSMFLVTAAAVSAPMVLLLFMDDPPRRAGHAHPIRLRQFLQTIRRHWPGAILSVNLVFGMCLTVPFVFLANYIDEIGMTAIAPFFFAYAGWGLFLRVLLRRLPDRVGRRKVLLAGMVALSAGMCCFLLVRSSNPWWLVAPALLCGTGHSLMFHTMTALALEPFPNEVRGVGAVLSLMMLDLGQIAGAPVLGNIAYYYGYDRLFLTAAAACLAVAGCYAWSSVPVWRERRRRATAAAALDPGAEELTPRACRAD